ncbi:MAG: lipoyl synthase [Candidatus Scalindua sp.]|jgi:lipoic acid synthetase|nr:lipoyl synthase [Candidatus Scalindua sp.]MBT5304101.1 lipoyl synthase [Candidatus Scalindua sp.]MBT6053683.1 lipoyl synthase [Candidatus Scalindua sp.]MBT6230685.1 lipoyl synthase [Candidatus Scalindua sp.]MBT6564871.1 lipoyl synthase [Candidatus Scalindua sp.]
MAFQIKRRKLPDWLKVKIPSGIAYNQIRATLKENNLNTVCEKAKCPNIAECYGRGTATFLIMGDVCTRECLYCNIRTGTPEGLDRLEPEKIAVAVNRLSLNYAVITSVTRDDLPDFGAEHFYNTVTEIRKHRPECKVEILTPEFKGNVKLLDRVLASTPYIFNHNIETVRDLFPYVRPDGNYNLSLKILEHAGNFLPYIKSGLMIGLGEAKDQIRETLHDLSRAGVAILTIGQYLQPGAGLSEVKKYYTIQEFNDLKEEALEMGFSHVFSGPLVRSSYHAEDVAA